MVVNVHTDVAATLALASLRLHAPGISIRLVNCERGDVSRAWFSGLARRLEFTTVEQPIRIHCETLDRLFVEVDFDIVLLLDSDAEVLDPGLIPRCLGYFDDEQVFGAGFTEGPAWMGPKHGATAAARVAYFQERPWIPFSLFRTAMVCQALAAGRTFAARKVWNDFLPNARLAAQIDIDSRRPAHARQL